MKLPQTVYILTYPNGNFVGFCSGRFDKGYPRIASTPADIHYFVSNDEVNAYVDKFTKFNFTVHTVNNVEFS